ncbi:MAG: hypothetical protein H6708_10140 [Kofleriaceae bacterium]|nr:hypothetical protein [Kofleriaceae bacterium]
MTQLVGKSSITWSMEMWSSCSLSLSGHESATHAPRDVTLTPVTEGRAVSSAAPVVNVAITVGSAMQVRGNSLSQGRASVSRISYVVEGASGAVGARSLAAPIVYGVVSSTATVAPSCTRSSRVLPGSLPCVSYRT